MESTLQPDLREQIRLTILEHYPDSSPEQIEKTVSQIMVAVDPFEKALAEAAEKYRTTLVGLAR